MPRCEICKVELEKVYWEEGGGEWKCPRCGFTGIAVEPKGDK